MALFKISKGLEANLPESKTPGYCWYTTDSSLFYVDFEDENGEVQRKALSAADASTLCGASLETILNNSDVEIPTSGAVFRALEAISGRVTDIETWHANFVEVSEEEINALFTITHA